MEKRDENLKFLSEARGSWR